MVFSSIPFLYYFLPAVLIVYFLTPRKGKNAVLLIASLLFYGWGEPKLLLLMAATILAFYLCGLAIGKSERHKKLWLTVSVCVGVGLLGLFKYADFFLSSFNALTGLSLPLLKLALPVGISFYTFQCLSYTVDVYRGQVEPQRNLVSFGAYVALFPQLIAGPIVRYRDVARELETRKHSLEDIGLGLRRFVIGLAKKVILADNLALLGNLYRQSTAPSVVFAWLYALSFMLNIYFDFSGYSDMAIGLGRMFGFEFSENFNYPYISDSITEFWRRWHISLSTWFREYVYIPLGGNRVTVPRHILNLLIVWSLTGLWHGASWNFVLWGTYYGVLLIVEKYVLHPYMEKWPGWVRHLYTLVIVMIGWTFFSITDFGAMKKYFAVMLGVSGHAFANMKTLYLLRTHGILLALGMCLSTPAPMKWFRERLEKEGHEWQGIVLLMLILILSIAYLVFGSYNPFLYFRF